MRIGLFSDSYLPGTDGIAVSVETFRIELEKMGHEVYVICPAAGLRVREPSKRVIRFPAFKGLFYEDYQTSLFFPPQALKRIDKAKLDIVHYQTPGQVGLLGAYYAKRRNLPLITTYHTDLHEYVLHYKNVLPGAIILALLAPLITGGKANDFRSAISLIRPQRNWDHWHQEAVERGLAITHNACDEIIAPSQKIKKMLEKWSSPTPISVLPTGVDRLPSTKKDIAAWRKKLGLKADTPVILFVGRLGSEKNLDLLLEAYADIAVRNKEVQLVVVGGSGSFTESSNEMYVQAARDLFGGDRITFTGQVPHAQLGGLYGLASVFAFPSLTETQGMVVNEAAQAGVPIVIVDRDVNEVVHDGVNGYIAKPTAKDLAQKIERILALPPDQSRLMGQESERLAANFGARQQAEKLLRLYQEVIERHYATTKPARRFPWRKQSAS